MTTIAYRDGVLAAEAQVTSGSALVHAMSKIAASEALDGGPPVLGGGVGSLGFTQLIIDWIRAVPWHEDLPRFVAGLPKPTEDDGAVLISRSGEIFLLEDSNVLAPLGPQPFFAMGSGRNFAFGAMAMGATAEQAVEIACRYDIYSGGRITSLSRLPRPSSSREVA